MLMSHFTVSLVPAGEGRRQVFRGITHVHCDKRGKGNCFTVIQHYTGNTGNRAIENLCIIITLCYKKKKGKCFSVIQIYEATGEKMEMLHSDTDIRCDKREEGKCVSRSYRQTLRQRCKREMFRGHTDIRCDSREKGKCFKVIQTYAATAEKREMFRGDTDIHCDRREKGNVSR